MIKNVFQKIPQKNHFFGIVLSKSFGPAEKTQFFPTRKIPKISLFFRRRTSKKCRKFDPLRDGSDAMYPRKGNMYSDRFPKKKSFFWDFSKCKLRESEFPRLFVISPNYRFHHPHPSSPFGFIICIRVIMAFAEAVEGKREIRIFLSNH